MRLRRTLKRKSRINDRLQAAGFEQRKNLLAEVLGQGNFLLYRAGAKRGSDEREAFVHERPQVHLAPCTPHDGDLDYPSVHSRSLCIAIQVGFSYEVQNHIDPSAKFSSL